MQLLKSFLACTCSQKLLEKYAYVIKESYKLHKLHTIPEERQNNGSNLKTRLVPSYKRLYKQLLKKKLFFCITINQRY